LPRAPTLTNTRPKTRTSTKLLSRRNICTKNSCRDGVVAVLRELVAEAAVRRPERHDAMLDVQRGARTAPAGTAGRWQQRALRVAPSRRHAGTAARGCWRRARCGTTACQRCRPVDEVVKEELFREAARRRTGGWRRGRAQAAYGRRRGGAAARIGLRWMGGPVASRAQGGTEEGEFLAAKLSQTCIRRGVSWRSGPITSEGRNRRTAQ
jgi:hypothetical protein